MTFALVSMLVCVATGARAQAADGPTPFIPGFLSTGPNIYRGTFDADGRTFYYFEKTGADTSEDYRIFRSRLVNS